MMEDDFEDWEQLYELEERKDYPGLVALCERDAERCPSDLHAWERLGQAYLLNGQNKKALEVMGRLHRNHPDIDAFQHIILDALFALGKTERDFPWRAKPEIFRIGEAADLCFEHLRPKRKPRLVTDLYSWLHIRAYLMFNKDELMEQLKEDPRFIAEGEAPWRCGVSVRRKSAGKS